MTPADQLAAAIQRRLQRMVEKGPVVTGAHVVLTQPDQLDRSPPVDRLDDMRRLHDVVGLRRGTAAETASGVEHVDLDLLRFEVEQCRHPALIDCLELFAIP